MSIKGKLAVLVLVGSLALGEKAVGRDAPENCSENVTESFDETEYLTGTLDFWDPIRESYAFESVARGIKYSVSNPVGVVHFWEPIQYGHKRIDFHCRNFGDKSVLSLQKSTSLGGVIQIRAYDFHNDGDLDSVIVQLGYMDYDGTVHVAHTLSYYKGPGDRSFCSTSGLKMKKVPRKEVGILRSTDLDSLCSGTAFVPCNSPSIRSHFSLLERIYAGVRLVVAEDPPERVNGLIRLPDVSEEFGAEIRALFALYPMDLETH